MNPAKPAEHGSNPAKPAEHGSHPPKPAEHWRRALAIILAAGIVRAAIASQAPLFPDETYYWEWSRRLSTGYFDHPPLVAWLIRLGTLVFGDTPLGVRAAAVLAGIAGSLIVAMTARRIAGDRAAFVAAAVFAVMPLSAAGLILATPDAGLLTAAALVVYAFVRVLEHPANSRQSLLWWCVAGVAQGVAFWSKYTAILIPAGIAIALMVNTDHRARLREAGPYAATMIASLVFSPVLLWNASHDWVSFTYQLQHGLVGSGGSILRRESELIGGQLGVVSPVLFAMMTVAVAKSVRGALVTSRILSVATLFVFAFFIYSATQRRVEANWPALAYVPATLLLAAHAPAPPWNRWLNGGIAVAITITLTTYVNTFVPILPVPAPRDPAARASGWGDLARVVAQVRDSQYQSLNILPGSRLFIAGNRYQEASELAFHLADHPLTLSTNIDGRPNQYDLWPTFEKLASKGDNLVIVLDDLPGSRDENDVEGIHPAANALLTQFAYLKRGPHVALVRRGNVVKDLRVWVLMGWLGGWPPPLIRSAQ